jgi:cysteine desulfuration protein SufE
MNIKKTIEVLINEFSIIENWEHRYEYLIELGKNYLNNSINLHISEKMILECKSRVWLEYYYNGNKIFFYADSDALIPKGIIFVLIRIYSNKYPEEIIKTSINSILSKISINISYMRYNGLKFIFNKMKYYTLLAIIK